MTATFAHIGNMNYESRCSKFLPPTKIFDKQGLFMSNENGKWAKISTPPPDAFLESLKPSRPFISPDIEELKSFGYFYECDGFLGHMVKLTKEPLPLDEIRKLEEFGLKRQGMAVSFTDAMNLATNALIAERELISGKIDLIANKLLSNLDGDIETVKFSNEILDDMALLYRFVNGEHDHSRSTATNEWWQRGRKVDTANSDPALELMRSTYKSRFK